MFPLVCVCMKFLLCNILLGLVCIWNNMYKICAKYFLMEHFSCVRSSHGLCARAQLRGNIGSDHDFVFGPRVR